MNIPKWLETAVFYEIYPQSFYDTNGDGIGDIAGITEKLDYVAALGCNAIWINPLFESPFMDAGYDISDYYKVAPRYGTNDDLKELFAAAHRRGMHVLLDLVPGHTSDRHPWFTASASDEKNEFSDRYIWTNDVQKTPKGMMFTRGLTPRNACCVTNYYSCQPALNYGFAEPEEPWQQSPDDEGPKATVEEIKKIMCFWLDAGCDGFRVDMAGTLIKKDPEGKANIKFWQKMRAFLDREYPEAAIISEWGDPEKALTGGFHMDFLLHFGISHYVDMFHSKTPYFCTDESGSAAAFFGYYLPCCEKTCDKGLTCIPSGNHDMPRMSYYLDTDMQKLAFAFLLSMPGAPFIYYGDEIGMRYDKTIRSKEGGYIRTPSRTPMQWNGDKNAGFSAADKERLYLPVDESPDRPTVKTQESDENSLLCEVKRLIRLRADSPALGNTAGFELVSDGYPLVYRRKSKKQTVTVIINPSKEEKTVNVNGKIIYCTGAGAKNENGLLTVSPRSAVFVEE